MSLLCLVMIVKNEAQTITRTLLSAKPAIDRYSILDTGSTDGTQDIIKAVMAGTPGDVYEGEFVDFAATRNEAISLAGEDSTFLLLLDADDVLDEPERLRKFLQDGAVEAAYLLMLCKQAHTNFDTQRVVRSKAGYRYEGVVHEVLVHPTGAYPLACVRIPGVVIDHTPSGDSPERTMARWERDVVALKKVLEDHPEKTRETFYLAQTLKWLGRNAEAIRYFDKRIAMGGWAPEIFESKLQRARATAILAKASGQYQVPFEVVARGYLEAHAQNPCRAEPLYDLAAEYSHGMRKDEHALCVLYARRAYELPYPKDEPLFVEKQAYEWGPAHLLGWHCFYLGPDAWPLGYEATKKALSFRPDSEADARNLLLYETERGMK